MEFKKQRLEILVGLFLVMGLAILGVLIVMFGKFGDRFERTYPLEISFSDATGVVKGSQVLLGGAKVGSVYETPELSANYDEIIVSLFIFADTRIPEGSKFTISKSGLLGDSYISIQAPEERNGKYIPENTKIIGESGGGLEGLEQMAKEIASKAGDTLDTMKVALVNVNETVDNMDKLVLDTQKIFNEENREKFKTTLANLEETTTKFSAAADRFEPVLEEAKGTLEKTGVAIEKAENVFDEVELVLKEDIKPALSNLDPALVEFRKTAAAATFAVNSLHRGSGLLPALISDSELKIDFEALVENLKEHGVIFYRDSAGRQKAGINEKEGPSPWRKR